MVSLEFAWAQPIFTALTSHPQNCHHVLLCVTVYSPKCYLTDIYHCTGEQGFPVDARKVLPRALIRDQMMIEPARIILLKSGQIL